MYGVGLAKGLMVTLRHMFKPPTTVQFPEEVRDPGPRPHQPALVRRALHRLQHLRPGLPDGCILVATEPRPDGSLQQGALRDRLPHLHVLRPLHRGLPLRGDPARRHLHGRRLLLRRHVPRQVRAHAAGPRAPAEQRLHLPQRHEGADVRDRLHRGRSARRGRRRRRQVHTPRSPASPRGLNCPALRSDRQEKRIRG